MNSLVKELVSELVAGLDSILKASDWVNSVTVDWGVLFSILLPELQSAIPDVHWAFLLTSLVVFLVIVSGELFSDLLNIIYINLSSPISLPGSGAKYQYTLFCMKLVDSLPARLFLSCLCRWLWASLLLLTLLPILGEHCFLYTLT
jgi:hypothetical protein